MSNKTSCEEIVKGYLPAIRSLIAKQLTTQYGLSQIQVAQKLGTTQAAISQYLSSRRGMKTSKQLIENTQLREALEQATSEIAKSDEQNTFSIKLCNLCSIIRKEIFKLNVKS